MSDDARDEITDLLIAWNRGDRAALDRLTQKVYDRLRRLAGSFLNRERPDHTLETTELVHEAFPKLVRQERVTWRDRAHFFAIAATVMRRILLDHARRRGLEKHGGKDQRVALEELERLPVSRPEEMVALDDALRALEARDSEAAKVVELRYFGGMNKEEIAEVLGISRSTVTRRWQFAKRWLYSYMNGDRKVDV